MTHAVPFLGFASSLRLSRIAADCSDPVSELRWPFIQLASILDRLASFPPEDGATASENSEGQHKTTELYEQFLAMLEAGRCFRDRNDGITCAWINRNLPSRYGSEHMFDFRAEEVVERISPRPVIFLHSSEDSVTPREQSIAMFDRAGLPKDLHLFSETDHFMFDESNLRVRTVVADWLSRFFPVRIAEH
jgi:pimeloyl-ACP methyl ester carboxylesterase